MRRQPGRLALVPDAGYFARSPETVVASIVYLRSDNMGSPANSPYAHASGSRNGRASKGVGCEERFESYYNFNNPATGDVEAKAAFQEPVRTQGVPLLVGSGYNP